MIALILAGVPGWTTARLPATSPGLVLAAAAWLVTAAWEAVNDLGDDWQGHIFGRDRRGR